MAEIGGFNWIVLLYVTRPGYRAHDHGHYHDLGGTGRFSLKRWTSGKSADGTSQHDDDRRSLVHNGQHFMNQAKPSQAKRGDDDDDDDDVNIALMYHQCH